MHWITGIYTFKYNRRKKNTKYINEIFYADMNSPILHGEHIVMDSKNRIVVTKNNKIIKYTTSDKKSIIVNNTVIQTKYIFISHLTYKNDSIIAEIDSNGIVSDTSENTNKTCNFVCTYIYKNKKVSIKDLTNIEKEYERTNKRKNKVEVEGMHGNNSNTGSNESINSTNNNSYELITSHSNKPDLLNLIQLYLNNLTFHNNSITHTILSTFSHTNVFTFIVRNNFIYVYVTNKLFNLLLLHNYLQGKEIHEEYSKTCKGLINILRVGKSLEIVDGFSNNILLKYNFISNTENILNYTHNLINNNDITLPSTNAVYYYDRIFHEISPFIYTDLVLLPVLPEMEYLLHGPYYKIVSMIEGNSEIFYITNTNNKISNISYNNHYNIISRKLHLSYSNFPLIFHCKSGVTKAYVNECYTIESSSTYDIDSNKCYINSDRNINDIIVFLLTTQVKLDYLYIYERYHIDITVVCTLIKRICIDRDIDGLNKVLYKIKNEIEKYDKKKIEEICKAINNYHGLIDIDETNNIDDFLNLNVEDIAKTNSIVLLLEHNYVNRQVVEIVKDIYKRKGWKDKEPNYENIKHGEEGYGIFYI